MGFVRSETEEVKRRTNIVDVVSEYVPLKKSGVNYTGLCPFHKEKTPSFSVNEDKQIFYCFGCGESGDVFAFIMKINDMSFPEALRYVAGKVGISLSQEYRGADSKVGKSLREEILRVNGMAADYYAGNLLSVAGREARVYLKRRGLREDVARAFRLGYSLPGWHNLNGYFESRKVSSGLLEKAGLVVRRDDGTYYDRFRGRLMFPIEGVNGNVVAFGGRSLGDEVPKYLNSPESPVYVKGRNLFGLNRAKEEIRRHDEAIIVEGYFDFLRLWNAGMRNVVATLGTALTVDQLSLLRRYTRNIVLLFDSDEGGRHAIERSLKLFVAEKMHAKVVILPEGCDPDTYVLKEGKDALEGIIFKSQSMIDYYIDHIIGTKKGLEDRLETLGRAVGFIVQIDDVKSRDIIMTRVSERLRISEEILRAEIRREISSKGGKSREREEVPHPLVSGKADPIELNFIHLLMEHPEWHRAVQEEKVLDNLLSSELRALGQYILEESRREGKIDVNVVVDRVDDEEMKKKLFRRFMEVVYHDAGIAEREFTDTVLKIKRRWFKQRRKLLEMELVKAQEDKNRCDLLLSEQQRLVEEEKELSFSIREH